MAPKKQTADKPTAQEPTAQAKPPLVARVVAPMQSAGRIGKSSFMDLLLGYYEFAGVTYGGMDADEEHSTLSDRYAGFVPPMEEGGEAENIPLFPVGDTEARRRLLDALATEARAERIPPIVAIDFPAQMTEELLTDFTRFHALDVLADCGIRLTVPLFLLDDRAAAESLAKIVKTFGDKADYVLVRNPARGTSRGLESRGLIQRMMESGTPVIDMAEVSKPAMEAVANAERAAGRFLPFAQVAKTLKNPSPFAAMEIESLIWTAHYQMEDAAAILTPNPSLIQRRIDRSKYPRPVPVTGRQQFGNKLDLMD